MDKVSIFLSEGYIQQTLVIKVVRTSNMPTGHTVGMLLVFG